MTTNILVTGATGTIGSQVVKALRGAPGVTVRAAVRSAEKAKALAGDGVVAVDFDYANEGAVAKSLEGVDAVFLVTPFVPNQAEIAARFVAAAKKAGVARIVKLSAIGVESEPGIQLGRWHRASEKAIEASGISYTFLRPNNFFENFIGYYPPGADGNIYLPLGDAKVSYVAGADIAAVAKVALTQTGHEGKAYDITGSEAFGVADAAKAIGEVTGRTITYVDVPEQAAQQGMAGAGMPDWMVDAMMELHAIDKAGYASAVTDVVQKLTGRAPTTFPAFAKENAARWKK